MPARLSQALLGLWALVVDAAPCDASGMSGGLLATLILEDESSTWSAEDSELVESAARCDQDSLLERPMMTGWRLYGRVNVTSTNW